MDVNASAGRASPFDSALPKFQVFAGIKVNAEDPAIKVVNRQNGLIPVVIQFHVLAVIIHDRCRALEVNAQNVLGLIGQIVGKSHTVCFIGAIRVANDHEVDIARQVSVVADDHFADDSVDKIRQTAGILGIAENKDPRIVGGFGSKRAPVAPQVGQASDR